MVELFGQFLNVETYRHQPHRCFSQPLDGGIAFLFAEILTKRLYQSVVTDTISSIECVQRGQLIDENPCVFIDNKDLERLLERKFLMKAALLMAPDCSNIERNRAFSSALNRTT